ncbi:MAG: ABC transporter ATP-binding protein [Ruminococcus sp.]|nr:ABC transporter ATP-binding protein [Ruminococcus sp.]
MSVLKLENVSYSYTGTGKNVIQDLSLEFEKGKIYSIVGRSGAGKTTLLSLLSGLAAPTAGNIYMDEKDIRKIDKYEYRSQYVGVIFQSFNLLPKLTAAENVELSMDISKKKFTEKHKMAMGLLKKVGLSEEEGKRRILKLSGGQQQRVAIARALSYDPQIILADEPTGNLDQETQTEIMNIFKELAHKEGKCVILVTHSPQVASESDIVYRL